MENEILFKATSLNLKTELMRTGWNLPIEMSEEDWKKAGSFLVDLDQAKQWWLGDWWNSCKWGDGQKACEELGVDYENARKCGSIAKVFKLLRRRNNLSFSHHQEVCSIKEIEMQDKLLNWCLSEPKRKTVKELREKVQSYLAMKDWGKTEKTRRFDAEAGITVIANLQKDANLINWAKTEGLYVAIDRSSPWGNPFEIPGDGNRDDVCESYAVYFELKKSLHKKLPLLRGKVLGCHCYPERCHGDFLAKKATNEN